MRDTKTTKNKQILLENSICVRHYSREGFLSHPRRSLSVHAHNQGFYFPSPRVHMLTFLNICVICPSNPLHRYCTRTRRVLAPVAKHLSEMWWCGVPMLHHCHHQHSFSFYVFSPFISIFTYRALTRAHLSCAHTSPL